MSVKGADGSPVADADVAVVVVDEAVLSLTGYKLADPIAAMYAPQTDERPVDYLRNSLVLANPSVFGAAGHHADDGRGGRHAGRRRPRALQATKASRSRGARRRASALRACRPVRCQPAPGADGYERGFVRRHRTRRASTSPPSG